MILLAKLLIAPLLLAASVFAARRWGGSIGGLLLGLPVVSGPTSAIIFAEHGAEFARTSARTALLGIVATAVFCYCYSVLAEREGWRTSLVAGYAGCLGSVWLFAHARLEFASSILFAAGALTLIARMSDLWESEPAAPHVDGRELGVRMALASGAVWIVTACAWWFGPGVAGLLAPLPVLVTVMTVRTHRGGARASARTMLRGTILGSWGGAGFFSATGLLLGRVPAPLAYGIAIVMAVGAAWVALAVSTGRLRGGRLVFGPWATGRLSSLHETNGSVAVGTRASLHVIR